MLLVRRGKRPRIQLVRDYPVLEESAWSPSLLVRWGAGLRDGQARWPWLEDADFVDADSFFLRKEYHHIAIHPRHLSEGQEWFVGVHNMRTAAASELTYELRVSSHARAPCPRNCLNR